MVPQGRTPEASARSEKICHSVRRSPSGATTGGVHWACGTTCSDWCEAGKSLRSSMSVAGST